MPFFRLVPHGPPAALALRDAIAEAKRGDALAPVTVAVPSNYAGLSLRRRLGAERDGLINVRFLVLARAAELLGAPALAATGRRPLTGPVRGEAVRAALAADAGIFRDVAAHRSTERSLESTFRDLRQAPERSLDAVAGQSERAGHVVRLYREFRRITEGYYDEEELAFAAAEAVRAGSPALRDVGHVVLYLLRRLSPAERALVEALAAADRLSALVGLTSDATADAPARQVAAQLEAALGRAEKQAPDAAPAGTRIVAVADAEEEVRTAQRLIMRRLEQGTPLHRMAVLYPTAQPYALLAHEQFQAAGVTHNGPSVRMLSQTLSGRTLLGLLHLREKEFSRETVMDWLSAAPVLEEAGGRPAPAHRWDTLSRSAGVVAGAAQWRDRLARHQRSLEDRLDATERTDEGDEWRATRLRVDIEQTGRLERFLRELVASLSAGGARTWPEFGAWARGLLERYLGGEGHRSEWPDVEIEAHRAVGAAIEALSNLGELRPGTDEQTFRRALERELETPAGRIGRFGEGVLVGRIADALGTDFDEVFVLGMTEGLVPPRERDDPLLPDHERSAGDVPPRTSGQAEQRRDYLAALASAPERVLIFPRADLRGQRGRLPARWLLETASQLEGKAVFSTDFDRLVRAWYTVVPSFEGALKDGLPPASAQEYDLRSLLLWCQGNTRLTDHYLVASEATLASGLTADLSRHHDALTRWDGRVDGAGLRPSKEQPVSPTALQNWASCPFRYFLGHVLRIAETERPEETLTLSPLERGNLIHEALEAFIRQAPTRSSPGEAWNEDERALLLSIGERLCDEYEAKGVTGKPLLWRMARARVLRDLAGFLDKDEELRLEHGVVPADVELAFGLQGATQPAVVVSLDDGRDVAFRGRIDRVDRAPDGSLLLVIDYKTGRLLAMHRNLTTDYVQGGRLLQLPVYAHAARQRFGDARVEARYWFVTEQEEYKPAGFAVEQEQLQQFRRALHVILGGIEQGLFPARPGEPSRDGGYQNCMICPYDRVCPSDRARVWDRKRLEPGLHEYLDLAGE